MNFFKFFVLIISLSASLIRFSAMLKYSFSFSIPMKFLPVFTQATPVVPLPIQQSKTTLFLFELASIIVLKRSNGFSVGCCFLSIGKKICLGFSAVLLLLA